MLKIKDNVDLKELEKVGFEKKRKYYRFENIAVEIDTKNFVIQAINLDQYGGFKTINGKNSSMIHINSKIYDLIQAGLVEKAGEEKS